MTGRPPRRPGLRRALAASALCGVILSQLCVPARAEYCDYIVDDPLWEGNNTSVSTGLKAAFDGNEALLQTEFTQVLSRMTSAVAVDAQQTSLNGSQASTTVLKSQEAYASAIAQQQVSEQVLQADAEFGQDGLSVDACNSTTMLSGVVEAFNTMPPAASALLDPTKVYGAGGSAMSGPQAIGARLASHRARYCSGDEAAAGVCASAGANAAADVTTQTLFDPAADDDEVDALINNLVGDLPAKPGAALMSQPEGVLRMSTALRAEGERSAALSSLAALRASFKPIPGQMNVSQALDQLLATYGGGPGYDAWYTAAATRNRYGLLRELNKLHAVRLKLQSYRAESGTRVGAMISSLLAGEATDLR